MNESESVVAHQVEMLGYRVLRGGWPDFLVIANDGDTRFAIEVKAGGDSLSPSQIDMINALEMLGLPVRVVRTANLPETLAMLKTMHPAKPARPALDMDGFKLWVQAQKARQRAEDGWPIEPSCFMAEAATA